MDKRLDTILTTIMKEYSDDLSDKSIYFVDVNIGQRAMGMGFEDLGSQYKNAEAVVFVKGPKDGMKVMIDGRTFVNYSTLGPGIAVPSYVARQTALKHEPFTAADSLVRIFN